MEIDIQFVNTYQLSVVILFLYTIQPAGMIADSRLKELTPPMPVMFIKAVTVDRQDTKNVYDCPVYKTRERGPTFVWTFNLKTKEKPAKWTVAGVALLLAS